MFFLGNKNRDARGKRRCFAKSFPHWENEKLPVPVSKLTLTAALIINTSHLNANLRFQGKEWLWIRFGRLLKSLFWSSIKCSSAREHLTFKTTSLKARLQQLYVTSTGAEEANVSSHIFTLPVCPLTAIGNTVQRICFCTLGNFERDLAIHDHSCQVPGSQLHNDTQRD